MHITELQLINDTTLRVNGKDYPCTIGRGGVAEAGAKREGDLKTPRGRFAMRSCYYRPDKFAQPPETGLPTIALTPNHGWCDDVNSAHYNLPVMLPFPARHETLWRDDDVYDLIIPLGYNDGVDGDIIVGAGSAIFMHIMRADGVGTEGCIALKKEDLLALLPHLTQTSSVVV